MQNFIAYIDEAVQELDALLATRPIDFLTSVSTHSPLIGKNNETEKKQPLSL